MSRNPGFDINAFNAQLNSHGVQRTNKFMVRIPLPRGMLNQHYFDSHESTQRNMEFWLCAAPYPGVGLNTHATLRYGYGPIERKPVAPIFVDSQLMLIADAEGLNRRFFHDWINMTIAFDLQQGINPAIPDGVVGNNPMHPFELSYKREYAVDVNIITFNDAGQKNDSIILQEAFPTLAGEVSMNWSENQAMYFPVTMTHMNWYREKLT